MTVTQASGSVIVQPGQQIQLSSLFTPVPGMPATIGIDIFDDGCYTQSNPGALGYLSGNGARSTNSVVTTSNQDYGVVLFQYDATKGQYYNSTLGYWNDIAFVSPTGNDHAELLSVFAFKNGSTLADFGASLKTGGINLNLLTDYGDLSVVAQTSAFVNPFPGAAAGHATPNEICAIAQTYAGKPWHDDGCQLLAQVVAGLAGSSLPFTTVAEDSTPANPHAAQSNGEWIVAYDGSTQANPSIEAVEAMIRPGDVVNLAWASGGGHIFTVVSGSGANALVIDNISTVKANDGSPDDIIITPPHSIDTVLRDGAGANVGAIPFSLQVYRLDTPIISMQASAPTLDAGSSLPLASLFMASDPAGKAVSEYQVYDSAAGSGFTVNGAQQTSHSADTAITVSSLSGISLTGGISSGSDVVEVRGFNGSYWGDWQSLTVTGAPAVTVATAGQASAGSTVVDSAQTVAGSLDSLAGPAAKGTISSITLTDAGIPNLAVTAAQFAADSTVLNEISSPHTVTVQINGTAAGHDFSSDHWTGASALHFADQTVIVAAMPGPANAVTTGNVTELYSAVLAREPDVGGLAFYQNYLKTNAGAPLLQFAEWFLSSSEYSSAHNYAQTTTGETQFINDSYQNLLHRAPGTDEVNFYLTNVLEKPGTQLQNHAQMLVYFSASTEFLSDVQITAAHPASAQHWLFLT